MKTPMIMKRIFLFYLFAIWTAGSFPSPSCRVTQITTNDGLSNNTVRAVFQDSQGYMWFCTPDGLNRYDGANIVVYRPSPGAGEYMTDNKIRNIQEDNTGHIWVGLMSEHFDCYDMARHRFIPMADDDGKVIRHNQIVFVNDTTWLWGNTTGCVCVTFDNDRAETVEITKNFPSLASVYVNFIEKGNDALWIGTEKGLFRWDGREVSCVQEHGNFVAHCAARRSDMFLSREGDVYMVNKGGDSVKRVKGTNHGHIYGTVSFGSLWLIYSANGCAAFNLTEGAFVTVPDELNVGETRRLIYDNKGNCWLSDRQCRLIYVNNQRSMVKRFSLMPEDMLMQNYEFYSAYQGRNDRIWISTNGNGLFCYDMRNDELRHYSSSGNSAPELPSAILKSVFEDRSGSVWLGTALVGVTHLQFVNSTGVQIVDLSTVNDGQSNQARLLKTVNGGRLIAGNRNGDLFWSDYRAGKIVPKPFAALPGVAYCAYEDENRQMWIGTKGRGIFVGDRNYVHVQDDETSLSDDNVYDIQSDAQKRLWIATLGGGLNLAVRGSGGTVRFRHFFNSSSDKYIRKLSFDVDGWIWMATSNGVIAFNPEHLITDNSSYIRLSEENGKLTTNEIRTIFCDANGRIWIAEAGYGISVCQPNGNYENIEVHHYSAADGIINPMVQAFEEDNMGMMWMSTEYGITRFNIENGHTNTYFFSPDIMTNNFCENSSCRLDDGRLVFGTNSGVIVISPDMVKPVETGSEVYLTEIRVNGTEIEGEEVVADYDFNVLDMYFSTFNYSSIVPILYMYRLDGRDDDWREPTKSNCFSIRELPPGEYTLHVRAITSQGNWSRELAVPVIIRRSLWLSWWAIVIYVLVIGAVGYNVIIRNRHVTSLREQISEQGKKMTLMQNMFAEGVKKDANIDESEKKFLEDIERVAMASIGNAEFTSEDFAERLNMGHTTFYSTMSRLTGKSPKEYLRHIRMKEAARLLLTSNKNVSEVAYQVGFNEISYFSKCFKRHFGVSPQNYKRDNSLQ